MAHYATNRFSYWEQLGILVALTVGGVILGIIGSIIPLVSSIDFSSKADLAQQVQDLLKPENANALRISQAIGTILMFLFPAFMYARICHVQTAKHLGFNNRFNWQQVLIAAGIMMAALPAVDALQELTRMLPWSKASLVKFDSAEEEYFKQVSAIARMDNTGDYIFSVVVIALLPGIVEEVLFRGAIQNLLSRWFKMPILAIVVTAVLFSAVHGSYLGFLSRFALGFALGWMYYRTGNIWLNIFAHFFNNAAAITSLYLQSKPGRVIDAASMDEHFPLWLKLVSIPVVVALFIAFEKVSKRYIDRPGDEVLIPGYSSNPFDNDIAIMHNTNQQ